MNNNIRRLALGTFIAFLVLTALFLLVKKTNLVIAAYGFSLFAIIALAITLLLIATGSRNKYLTNAAFPLEAFSYLLKNLAVSLLFPALEIFDIWTMPSGWFIFLHILLLAFFCWKLLSMDSGQEEIERVEQNVKRKTVAWKILRADAEELKGRTPAEFLSPVAAVCDAIRYADPMSDPALDAIEESIRETFHALDQAVFQQQKEAVQAFSDELCRKIKDRNNRVKLLK